MAAYIRVLTPDSWGAGCCEVLMARTHLRSCVTWSPAVGYAHGPDVGERRIHVFFLDTRMPIGI